jgi:hypothetical protein
MASSSCANSPPAYASYDVLVHQLAVLRPASFRPNLTVKPLPFASSYRLITTWFSTVNFLQGTYTPLVHAHAGRTQSHQFDRLTLLFRRQIMEALMAASRPEAFGKPF